MALTEYSYAVGHCLQPLLFGLSTCHRNRSAEAAKVVRFLTAASSSNCKTLKRGASGQKIYKPLGFESTARPSFTSSAIAKLGCNLAHRTGTFEISEFATARPNSAIVARTCASTALHFGDLCLEFSFLSQELLEQCHLGLLEMLTGSDSTVLGRPHRDQALRSTNERRDIQAQRF